LLPSRAWPSRSRSIANRYRHHRRAERDPSAIRPNKRAASRGDFKQAVFLDQELWQHFDTEVRVLEALRMVVSRAERSSRAIEWASPLGELRARGQRSAEEISGHRRALPMSPHRKRG